MAKALTRLGDVLATKKLAFLLQQANAASIDMTGILSEEDWKALTAEIERFGEERVDLMIEEYQDSLEDEEDDFVFETDEDDEEDDDDDDEKYEFIIKDFDAFAARHADNPEYVEERRCIQEARLQAQHLVDVVGMLLGKMDVLADRVAEYLLQPEVMKEYIMEAGDGVSEILKSILQMNPELNRRRRSYRLRLPVSENSSADDLMHKGYALVQDTPFWKSKDGRRHVTGMTVTADVLECFQRINTPEFEFERKTRLRVMACGRLAALYYNTVPVEIAYEIYRRICPAYQLDPVSLGKFIEIAETETEETFRAVEVNGKKYITEINNTYEYNDYEEEVPSEDGTMETIDVPLYKRYAETIQMANPTFYIPEAEEALEFLRYGWWPSREPYQKLREWITMFYMDERDMANEYPRFLQRMYPDQGYHDKYGMDDVERNTDERLSYIAEDMMLDLTPDNVIEYWDEIQGKIREDALEDLRKILGECEEQTNKWNFWGLMPKDLEPEIWQEWKQGRGLA